MSRLESLLVACVATLLVAGCGRTELGDARSSSNASESASPLEAHAVIEAIDDVELGGEFRFVQDGELIHVSGTVSGLDSGHYGFHIHEGTACDDRGGHFNPTERPHGAPDEPEHLRHVGDLGNLISRDGHAALDRHDAVIRLDGEHSVIGRALVIHANRDQFIPQPAGDAGTQIGCGIITAIHEQSDPS